MSDPRRLLPHEVEIVVTRELRKAGLDVQSLRARDRRPLSARKDEYDEYAVELMAELRIDGEVRRALVECRNAARPADAEAVRALHARLREPEAAPRRLIDAAPAAPAPPVAEHAIMFSTTGYETDAVREARTLGMPLLTLADGKAAFARTGYMMGDPPAWVPEYMAEVVTLDAAGLPRLQLVVAGESGLVLERPAAPAREAANPPA